VLLTNSAEVAKAGEEAGCYAVQQLDSLGAAADLAESIGKLLQGQALPHAAVEAQAASMPGTMAPALAAVLGTGDAAGLQTSEQQEVEGDDVIDMLLVVLDTARELATQAGASSDSSDRSSGSHAALHLADSLLRHLNQVPGFRDTVLLSLVLGPGQHPLSAHPLVRQQLVLLECGQQARAGAAAEELAGSRVRRPQQSYQYAGLDAVDVDVHRPAIVVHRLPGVIR